MSTWLSLTNEIKPNVHDMKPTTCLRIELYSKTWIRLNAGTLENSADPDQTLQNAASDQGQHCLHKKQGLNESEVPFQDHFLSLQLETIDPTVLSVLWFFFTFIQNEKKRVFVFDHILLEIIFFSIFSGSLFSFQIISPQIRATTKTSQWAHNVKMTSYQRRCDVITSHRRWYDVILMLCACWVGLIYAFCFIMHNIKWYF